MLVHAAAMLLGRVCPLVGSLPSAPSPHPFRLSTRKLVQLLTASSSAHHGSALLSCSPLRSSSSKFVNGRIVVTAYNCSLFSVLGSLATVLCSRLNAGQW